MKKIIAILLCLSISVAFCGCAASGARSNDSDNSDYLSDDSTDNNEMTTDNIVNWNNVNYKVNPVLSSSENIKNVETEEKGGITCVTFSWNYVDDESGEGYKDILMMYYNAAANEVANGSQSVLGSAYCQMLDDGTTQWTYYNENHKVIYKMVDNEIYDANSSKIGYRDQSGAAFDNDGNPLDLESLDDFIKTMNDFEN